MSVLQSNRHLILTLLNILIHGNLCYILRYIKIIKFTISSLVLKYHSNEEFILIKPLFFKTVKIRAIRQPNYECLIMKI